MGKAPGGSMRPENLIEKCKVQYALHDEKLLKECYLTMSNMLDWIKSEGERNNTCTYSITGDVCLGCRCVRAK